MRGKLKNPLKLSLLALTAITVMVAYQPVSVLASQEFISIALQSGVRNTRRTDSYTGNSDFNIQFERVSETPVSITFEAVVTTASDRTNQVLKYYVEPLYTETAPIVPRVLSLDEIRRQTTYQDRPIYEPQTVTYTSQYGNYVNTQNGTFIDFTDYSRNGQNVLRQGKAETWNLPTLTWSWTEQVQTGTEQVPVYTDTVVNYASHLGTENPEYLFSINPNISRGWGNGILHFRVTLDNGLLQNPNGGWGSSGILVIEINGVKYYDTANSSWWDALWLRRKQITIAGTADGVQTNYQMKLNVYKSAGTDSGNSVYLGTNVQDDFDDLRFTTDATPNVALDYWIESYVSGTSAVVWIEFDSIPASPSTDTWYIYYNYASATSGSNGANTFILFDHFADASLDAMWTSYGTAPTESGTVLDIVSQAGDNCYVYSDTAFARPKRLRGYVAFNPAGVVTKTFGFWMLTEYNWVSNGGESSKYNLDSYDSGSSQSQTTTVTYDTSYHLFEIRRRSSTSVQLDIDNTQRAEQTSATYNGDSSHNVMALVAPGTSHHVYLDWVFVANLTTTEPTWSTWGAEERGDTTATNPPTANSGAGWTDPANAYDNDADYAYVTSGTPSASNTWGTYGFSLAGATIRTVRVRYDAYSAGYSSAASQHRHPTGDDSDTASSTKSTGATFYGLVDEDSYDDADYYTMTTNAGTTHNTMTFPAFTIPSGASITNVKVYYRATNGGTANTRATVKCGTTYYDTTDSGVDPTNSYAEYSYAFTVNPATSAAWTYDEVNATDATTAHRLNAFGTSSTDNNPDNSISWLYIECNYTTNEYDDKIKVDVSWDGGSTWSSTQDTTLTSAETTYWYDVTAAVAWDSTKLNDSNLKVRALAYTTNNAEVVRLEYLPVEVQYIAATYNISNDPSTKAFGVVAASTTYYAKGSAPSNPVVDGDCTYTLTNNGATTIDLDMKITDFTGGVGWNIGAPAENQARITAYYSGQNPASGLVLANTDAEFYDALTASSHIHWDFKLETPTSHTDGTAKSATLTITATAED